LPVTGDDFQQTAALGGKSESGFCCFFFAQAREEEGIERKRVLFLLKLSPMSLGIPHLWGFVVLVFSLRGVVAAAIKCGG
jgi:hypothetical protein